MGSRGPSTLQDQCVAPNATGSAAPDAGNERVAWKPFPSPDPARPRRRGEGALDAGGWTRNPRCNGGLNLLRDERMAGWRTVGAESRMLYNRVVQSRISILKRLSRNRETLRLAGLL